MLQGVMSSKNYGVIIIGVLLSIGEMMGIRSSLEIKICLQGTQPPPQIWSVVDVFRLWDARYMTDSFLTLPAKMGAIRSVHFSPDGKYLAIAEPADYVHIYDATTGLYEDKQTIEYIGETAGVSFDPSGDCLFIGNADELVGSIYEFGRVSRRECDISWEDIIL